jgi:hypothetical protein
MRSIVVGVLFFFAVDAVLFRAGLYLPLLTYGSMQGFTYHQATRLEARKPDPQHDVLMLGDSRVTEGFNAGLATRQQVASGLVFVQGGDPGSTLRSTCYLLERVDPKADRYRAIVLTIRSFRQTPMAAAITDDRMLDADILAPVVSTAAFVDLSRSEPVLSDRIKLWSRVLIAALNYRADVLDLLLHPWNHLQDAAFGRTGDWLTGDLNSGHSESMRGLTFDPATGALSFPSWPNPAQRAQIEDDAKRHWPVAVPTEDAYLAHWTSRILRRYAGGSAQVFIVRLPFSPFPAAFDDASRPLASFVRSAAGLASVTIVPETTFTDLERPETFFDGRHLNAEGRRALTERLGGLLAQSLGGTVAATVR